MSGGTTSHLIVVDFYVSKALQVILLRKILHQAHITCNKNSIPFDDAKPWITSGIRLGTPACTTMWFYRI